MQYFRILRYSNSANSRIAVEMVRAKVKRDRNMISSEQHADDCF